MEYSLYTGTFKKVIIYVENVLFVPFGSLLGTISVYTEKTKNVYLGKYVEGQRRRYGRDKFYLLQKKYNKTFLKYFNQNPSKLFKSNE